MSYETILREVGKLPPEQQRLLVERLTERLRNENALTEQRPKWEDYAGSAPYPLCGEDAQISISRSRREADEVRRLR